MAFPRKVLNAIKWYLDTHEHLRPMLSAYPTVSFRDREGNIVDIPVERLLVMYDNRKGDKDNDRDLSTVS